MTITDKQTKICINSLKDITNIVQRLKNLKPIVSNQKNKTKALNYVSNFKLISKQSHNHQIKSKEKLKKILETSDKEIKRLNFKIDQIQIELKNKNKLLIKYNKLFNESEIEKKKNNLKDFTEKKMKTKNLCEINNKNDLKNQQMNKNQSSFYKEYKNNNKKFEKSKSEPKRFSLISKFSTKTKNKLIKKIKFDKIKTNENKIPNIINFKKTKSLIFYKELRSKSTENQLNEAFLTLSEKKHDWNKRIISMDNIERIIFKTKKISKDQLYLFKNSLTMQIMDLRSSIVKKVCNLLIVISKFIPKEINFLFDFFANALMSKVYNSTKAIKNPCTECLKVLVQNVCDYTNIKILHSYATDSHVECRQLSIEMIKNLLKTLPQKNEKKTLKYLLLIEDALKKTITDANGHVRKSAKKCLKEYCLVMPNRTSKVYSKLETPNRNIMRN